MTMSVGSGATELFPDDELIPRLKDRLMNPTPLNVPKMTVPAGNRKLLWNMTGTIYGAITDESGNTHRAQLASIFVSGLGRYMFYPTTAMERGIATTLEAGNPHLRKDDVVVQLEQQLGDRGLSSFKVLVVDCDSSSSSSILAVALTADVT